MIKLFKTIWTYFRHSWEDEFGQLSYRRVSQYIFLICMIKLAFRNPKNQWEWNVFLVFAVLYSLVASILTVQQLIQMITRYKTLNPPADDTSNTPPNMEITTTVSTDNSSPGSDNPPAAEKL